ncbi:MAG: metallophosphoesterase [Bacteroidota bacterium]
MRYNTPVIKKDQPDDSFKFRPLPQAVGQYPYHLNLSDVVPDCAGQDKLTFHMVGDTGSVRKPEAQQGVIDEMVAQFDEDEPPSFLYHLGDLVYHYGETGQYANQFFKPYENYPAPIFAIAGNHDSDVNPDSKPYQSLDAFTQVFCDTEPKTIAFSNNSQRKSMVQPNIYWTLDTPLATIIGLHSNVPKYGIITPEQRAWFLNELRTADTTKMLIICVHHAPFTADTNHGSSLYMIDFLESAYQETAVKPDIVFSGHVHNYQRFVKQYPDGKAVPYIVAGGGGFDELHSIADSDDTRFTADSALFNHMRLESYCDTKHGFLKIAITKTNGGFNLTGKYYAVSSENITHATLIDSFTILKG